MTEVTGRHADAEDGADSIVTSDPTELQADIDRTREELAATVDQLAAKLDVKTRARDSVAHRINATKESAAHRFRVAREATTGADGRPTPVALSVGGGVVAAIAAVVLVRLWLRPRRRQARRRYWRR